MLESENFLKYGIMEVQSGRTSCCNVSVGWPCDRHAGHAIAVMKDDEVVGHVPCELSSSSS